MQSGRTTWRPRPFADTPRLLCLILLTLPVAVPVQGAPPGDFPQWGPRANPLEPHVVWAKPLAHGPVRALLVAPRYTLYDAVLLEARLDVRFSVVPAWDSGRLDGPADTMDAPPPSVLLTRALDKNPDVIILANMDLHALSGPVQQAVADQVNRGVGLLLANAPATSAPAPMREMLDAALPAVAAKERAAPLTPPLSNAAAAWCAASDYANEWPGGIDVVHTGVWGRGRITFMDLPGDPPRFHCLLLGQAINLHTAGEHLDSYLSFLAHAIVWTAGRDLPLRVAAVDAVDISAQTDDPDAPPPPFRELQEFAAKRGLRQFTVRFTQPADRAYTVKTQVRRPGRGWHVAFDYGPDAPLYKGQQDYPIYLPGGAGPCMVDVWLFDGAKVASWHTQSLVIDDWPVIEELRVSKPVLSPHDSIDVMVRVPESPGHRALAGLGAADPTDPARATVERMLQVLGRGAFLVRATDAYGRFLGQAHAEVPGEGGTVSVTLRLADLVAPYVKLEAYALTTNAPEPAEWDLRAAAYAGVRLPVRHTPDPGKLKLVVAPDLGDEYGARAAARGLRALGVDIALTAARPSLATHTIECGLRPACEIVSLTPDDASGSSIRTPCLSDPAFTASQLEAAADTASRLARVGVDRFWLGRGNCLTRHRDNLCQSPSCLDGYHAWLLNAYGGLDQVNAAWGTQFDRWDDVAPPPESAARALGVYAPWIDFRLYMDSVFAGAHATAAGRVRAVAPKSRIGFGLAPGDTVYQGYDWPQLGVAAHDLALDPAHRGGFASLRSRADSDGCPVLVLRPSTDPAALRRHVWQALLDGCGAISWPGALGTAYDSTALPLLEPNGRPTSGFAEVVVELARVRRGVDHVLLTADRVNSGIAVLDSAPSRYVDCLESPISGDYLRTQRVLTDVLTHLGYQYDMVSAHDLIGGALDDYRLLVLPLARALSAAEVSAIMRFSKAGGHLLADVLPATFDGHGRPRTASPLAALFGVEQTPGQPLPQRAPVSIRYDGPAGAVNVTLPHVAAHAGLTPTGAVVLGHAPGGGVWFVRRATGVHILMNHVAPHYPLNGLGDDADSLRRLVAAALANMALPPAIDIETERRDPLPMSYATYRYGMAHIAAFGPGDPAHEPDRATFRFPHPHVYDVIAGEKVSRKGRVRVPQEPGQAAVFAALPYTVESVTVVAPKRFLPPGRLPLHLTVHAAAGRPGRHPVRIELVPRFGPDKGRPLDRMSRTIVCDGGQGDLFLPMAANEAPGPYDLVACDVLTGTSGRVRIRIGAS
ncbi:MAG: hypothetical protein GY851_02905 [bacterium]|nr:hypothetical protein [bacterium]